MSEPNKIDRDAFVRAIGGHWDAQIGAHWVHMDHKAIMAAAGFQPLTAPDDVNGGRRHAMGGVGHYWCSP